MQQTEVSTQELRDSLENLKSKLAEPGAYLDFSPKPPQPRFPLTIPLALLTGIALGIAGTLLLS